MGVLSGNPKEEPLHCGEVFQLWSMSTVAKGLISCYRTYLNHAGDKDLANVLNDMIEQAKLEEKECDRLLLDNKIVPAPAHPEKPSVRLEEIPAGARFSDMEIAAAISADNAVGLAACSQAIGASIREDIGALFTKYHATKLSLSLRLLRMNKDKGWLVPPPLHLHKSELVEA